MALVIISVAALLTLILPVAAVVVLINAWRKRSSPAGISKGVVLLLGYVVALALLAALGSNRAFDWPRFPEGEEASHIGALCASYVVSFLGITLSQDDSWIAKVIGLGALVVFGVLHVYMLPYAVGVLPGPFNDYLQTEHSLGTAFAALGTFAACTAMIGLHMLGTVLFYGFYIEGR